MSTHQEKQRIFDEYGIQSNKGNFEYFIMYNLFKVINNEISIESAISHIKDFIFSACDLVQAEQQKRIADNVKIEPPFEHFSQWIDKVSIINPENKIM